MTGGLANSVGFMGLAFSGGSTSAGLPVLSSDWETAATQQRKIRAMLSGSLITSKANTIVPRMTADDADYGRGRSRILPSSPVRSTKILPPLPIFQRFTRGEGLTSSATVKPSLVISSGALVSIVKLEPAGTVNEMVPSPVLAGSGLKLPSSASARPRV